MHRQIAGKLTGPVIKWFVLAVWLVLGIGSSVLGSKLIDVQDNQASSWLPGNAESTKALAKLEAFQSQNAIPTTVVYERTEGLSADDLAAAQSDAQQFADIDVALIGSGVRRSKLLLPGADLGRIPGAEVVEGLAR